MKEDFSSSSEKGIIEAIHQSLINFVRKNYAEEIDKAYEYFWEEEYPAEYFGGIVLDIGFVNFEDWLISDYRTREGQSFIDLYIEQNDDLSEDALNALEALKGSSIRLFEIVSDDSLKDILLNEDIHIKNDILCKLKPGDIFATRIFKPNSEYVMGKCIYPFNQEFKDKALGFIDNQFNRYIKNKNPDGDMRQFLKDEAYLFNVIWISSLFKSE
jgi:hypothetical protein